MSYDELCYWIMLAVLDRIEADERMDSMFCNVEAKEG